VRASDSASFDVAAFANDYGDLRSQELPAAPGAPFVLANGLNARTSGVEIAATMSITPRWQAHASYGYLWERFSRDADSRDVSNGVNEANDPSNLFSARTSLGLRGSWSLTRRSDTSRGCRSQSSSRMRS
jgi:outer membrane receptor protein involved in Fe transport